jgi:iron transport multicopper oxidase
VDIKEGEVIDIVINNHDGGEHPLHLHGHWYWVMARGADDAGDFDPKKVPLDKTPILRDTVTVNSNSYVVMRFVASNPGAWIFHCEWREGGAACVALAAGAGGGGVRWNTRYG